MSIGAVILCSAFTFLGSSKANAVLRGKVTGLINFFNKLGNKKPSTSISRVTASNKSQLEGDKSKLNKPVSGIKVKDLRAKFESSNLEKKDLSSKLVSKNDKNITKISDKPILSKYLAKVSLPGNNVTNLEKRENKPSLKEMNKDYTDIYKSLAGIYKILEDNSRDGSIVKPLDKNGNFHNTKLMLEKLESKLSQEGNNYNEEYFKRLSTKVAKNLYYIIDENFKINNIDEPRHINIDGLAKNVNDLIKAIHSDNTEFKSRSLDTLRSIYGIVNENIIKGKMYDNNNLSMGVESSIINLNRNNNK